MIIFQNEKYACLKCIRGHRSKSCIHKDRPLLQVRRRGRPPFKGARLAIMPDKESEYHITAQGQITIQPAPGSQKYVETAADGDLKVVCDAPSSPKGSTSSNSASCCNGGSAGSSKSARLKVKKRTENDGVYIPVFNGLYRKISHDEYEKHQDYYDRLLEKPNQETQTEPEHATPMTVPPVFMAPMSVEGTKLDDNQDYDLYYSASCMLGECPCGDGCLCDGCPDHDPSAKSTVHQQQIPPYDEGSIVLPPPNAPQKIGGAYCPFDNPKHLQYQYERINKGLDPHGEFVPEEAISLAQHVEQEYLNQQALGLQKLEP